MSDTQMFVLWMLGIVVIGFPVAVGMFKVLEAWSDRLRMPRPPTSAVHKVGVGRYLREDSASPGPGVQVTGYTRKPREAE